MTRRSIVLVVLFSIITFGIYHLYWLVKTKDEMNSMGATIPTGWLIIIPLVQFYWFWKYCEGVEHVSRGKMSAPVGFLLMVLLSIIGTAVIQVTFNEVADSRGPLPGARVA